MAKACANSYQHRLWRHAGIGEFGESIGSVCRESCKNSWIDSNDEMMFGMQTCIGPRNSLWNHCHCPH